VSTDSDDTRVLLNLEQAMSESWSIDEAYTGCITIFIPPLRTVVTKSSCLQLIY